MAKSDPAQWPPGDDASGGDSIAAQLASRFEKVPRSPGDAMDWAAIAARYEREAAALGDRPGAAELLFEAGRVFEERLGDRQSAFEFYRRSLAAGRRFLPNLRALRRLALDLAEPALADEALSAEMELTEDDAARAELESQLRRVRATSPAQPDGRTPSIGGPLGQAMAEAEGSAASDPAALLAAYQRCATVAPDERLSAQYLLAASAVAAEGLSDDAQAAALAQSAFARCPLDPLVRSAARMHAARSGDLVTLAEVLRADAAQAVGGEAAHALTELARLREARGEWAAATDVLEALAAAHMAHGGPGHRQEAIAAGLRRLELEEVQLGRLEEALRCCRDVLGLEPAQRTALATLGRLCARADDWAGVLSAFRAEAEAARDPRERAQRTYKAAQVLEEHLGRPAEAALAYRAALAQDPDLLAAKSALERLLEQEERWEELCKLVEDELVPDLPASEQVETLFRLARLEEGRLGDGAAAAGRYRRILELEPGNSAALHGLRLALEGAGAGEELAEVLLEEARRADSRRRLPLLQRRAEVLEELVGDPVRALEAWDELRILQPDHLPALRALGRLNAAAGRWDAVAAHFRAQAEAARDPEQAAELLLRAAEIAERQLSDEAAATGLYREALACQPAHLPALRALSRLYRSREEYEALAEVLSAVAASREAPAERAAAMAELGELCEERLRDGQRAIEAHQEALRADPGCVPSLRALERLYLQLGMTDELTALRRDALADSQASDRGERLLRLAWQEAERNRDPVAALAATLALAEEVPGTLAAPILELRLGDEKRQEHARAALAPAAPQAPPPPPPPAEAEPNARPAPTKADAVELARISEERLKAAADPGSRAAWAVQAGEAWEQAGDPDRALSAYQAALSASPAHLPALRAARNLFAQRRDWGAVRATLQAEGTTLLDGGDAAAAWREAGSIAEQWFGDIDGAVQDYRSALEREPSDPVALTRVEALLEGRGLEQLAEVHAARARADKDPHRSADAFLAAARAAQAAPEGRRTALAHLDEALERRPELAPALELRARLRAVSGQPSLALDDLERCLALGGDPATQLPLHLTAAALYEEKLLDPSGALRHAEAALALAPEHTEALSRLARLHSTAGRLPAATAALRRLLAVPGLPRQAVLEHGSALAALEAQAGELEAALTSCRRVLDVDPGHPEVLRLQVELERRRGDPRELAAALDAAAESARDAAVRGEAHVEAARLQAATPGTRDKAVDHLKAALEIEPERDDIRAVLAEVAEEPQPALSLEQHRRLLQRDPGRVASWTALYRLHSRCRSHDGAFLAAGVLRWLGAAAPGPNAEQLLLEGDRQSLSPPPPLLPADFDLLRAPGDRGPLAEVVAIAGDALGTLLTDPRETRGAPVRGDHPFRRTLAELARALGAGEFELYAAPLGRLTVEPGTPAAVRVGADLAHRSTAREQRFMLGRAAARLRTRSALVEAFPARFADAVGAAVRLTVPHYGGMGHPDGELLRRLDKALPRKSRRALEEPARALAHQRPPPDLVAWRAAAASTADRAGLALCGDVPTALDLLLRDASGRKPAPAERAEALRASSEAQALLAFAAGETHLALRQKLRVAIA
ncbi:MAG TPA: tetratricopeptide repeat protein [Anaeromyxobacter sp.]|nr:tetratricopeptide repeat protein [Anaeromyxobacter sp.]